IPWKGIASVDYYHAPIANDTGAHKGALTGENYAGLRYQKKYKEFLEVKLAEPLRRGQKYKFEYNIRLAFWSNAVLKSFGVHFSKVGYKNQLDVLKTNTVDTICKKEFLNNGFKWIKIEGIYQADGGEKFITIGNFAPNVKKDMARMNILKMGFKEAYYFVDDISLKWIKPKDDVVVEWVGSFINDTTKELQVKNDLKVGEKIALPNITFEKGHSYITPESFVELNHLAQFLFKHPTVIIQINGHSDNTGGKIKNQKISEQRAKMVFEYLIQKGVQNKMLFKGYGGQFPVATNDSEEGKAKNRRVEFEIVKQ
ncbi:MAG: OmpA family protein, partial [Bacteroidia bacterium]|nr:OmpA family protein [Bacteroidia bacterium]